MLKLANRAKEKDREYQLSRYHERRKFMIEHLGGKCSFCGSEENLQVDHVDNLPDKIPLGKLWGIAFDRLLDELTRCQLLCKSCHDDKSVNECGHGRGLVHGTLNGYKRYGCRCEECVKLYREKSREYMRKHRSK